MTTAHNDATGCSNRLFVFNWFLLRFQRRTGGGARKIMSADWQSCVSVFLFLAVRDSALPSTVLVLLPTPTQCCFPQL